MEHVFVFVFVFVCNTWYELFVVVVSHFILSFFSLNFFYSFDTLYPAFTVLVSVTCFMIFLF